MKMAKPSREGQEQAAVIEWSLLYPELRWLHSSLNGAFLAGNNRVERAKRWGILKKQGAKTGVHDLFLPVVRQPYHGLYIEMKNPETRSGLSSDQIDFRDHCEEQGYKMVTCWTAGEAICAIQRYMGWQ